MHERTYEVGVANLRNRLAMLSPTTGGAWITSVVRLEIPAHREGWTDELEPEPELLVHSYLGGPEMTTAQADNVEELRRFAAHDSHMANVSVVIHFGGFSRSGFS